MPCRALCDVLKIQHQPIQLHLLESKCMNSLTKHTPLNVDHFFFSKMSAFNVKSILDSHAYYILDRPQTNIPILLSCHICPFQTENSEIFLNHINKGPFANGHILFPFAKHNNETVIKIISSFFYREDELTIICSECGFVVSSLDQWEKMFDHAITHGSAIEELGLSLRQVEKNLDILVKQNTRNLSAEKKSYPCIPCGMFFSSITLLYAHLWLHQHPTHIQFCVVCSNDINSDMIEHIKLEHPMLIGKPFLFDWDPLMDNDKFSVIHQAKRYSHEERKHGFDFLKHEVLNFYSSCRPSFEFTDNSSLHGRPFLTHEDLQEVSKLVSDDKHTLGFTYYPNFQGEKYTRKIYPLLPSPLPPSLQKNLVSSFPGDLNAFLVEPAFKILKNDREIHTESMEILQLLDVFPANKRAYPIFLFGVDILQQMLLTENNRTLSFNGSPREKLHWPTIVTKNARRISPYQGPQPDLSYFDELEKSLFPLKGYKGLCVLEVSIQHLLNTSGDNKLLAYNLARSFFFHLLRIRPLPQFIILIGAVNSLPGKIKENGPTLCLFNAYIQRYAQKNNMCFLNPNVLGIRTLLSSDGIWKHYTSANSDQKIFDYRGALSKQGTSIFSNWIVNYARLAKQMAETVGIELTGSSEFAE